MAIMSTNAVAFLLLHKFRDGTTLDELAAALDDWRLDVRVRKRDTGFTGDSVDVINYAVSTHSIIFYSMTCFFLFTQIRVKQ